MLQRTRAEQVEPVYNEFVKRYTSLELESIDSNALMQLFKPLGLTWRSKNLVKLINYLSSNKIPESKKELMELPGVGNYVANAFLSLHRNTKAPITDSNAVRLWSRVFGFESHKELHKKKWFNEFTLNMTPDEAFRGFNYGVLDLTRTVCKPKPVCSECPLHDLCIYYDSLPSDLNRKI